MTQTMNWTFGPELVRFEIRNNMKMARSSISTKWFCGMATSYKFKPLIIKIESPLYLHWGAATRMQFTICIQVHNTTAYNLKGCCWARHDPL
jgi:hypothetical protein